MLDDAIYAIRESVLGLMEDVYSEGSDIAECLGLDKERKRELYKAIQFELSMAKERAELLLKEEMRSGESVDPTKAKNMLRDIDERYEQLSDSLLMECAF